LPSDYKNVAGPGVLTARFTNNLCCNKFKTFYKKATTLNLR